MKANKKINTKAKGYFSLSVLDKNGARVEDKCIEKSDNVITYEGAVYALTDDGSSRLFANYDVEVGTGSSEIQRSDTSLGSRTNRSAASDGGERAGNEVDNEDGTSTITIERTVAFGLGDVVGTISEVGLRDAVYDTFIAGQLIKDESGDPTTVTLLEGEQLVVTYTLEWTIPNDSVMIGSGTVTTEDETAYNYEMWAQPYFQTYDVGASTEGTRYGESNIRDEPVFRGSDGTTIIADPGDINASWSRSHDGSGTITFTSSLYSFAPGDFNSTDIAFFGGNSSSAGGSDRDIVDTTNVLQASGGDCPVIVKFTPPLEKSDQESLSFRLSFDLEV